MKLLIADDQNSVHMFLNQMLPYEELGITEVFHAKNGEEAWNIVQKELPELLLLDIQMPVMNGLALLEKISTMKFEHRVLILSAYNEFEYARKCILYGVQEYLLKPIDIKEMKQVLKKNIEELQKQQVQRCSEALKAYLESEKEELDKIPAGFGKHGFGVVVQKSEGNLSLGGAKSLLCIHLQDMAVHFLQVDTEYEAGKSECTWSAFYERCAEESREVLAGLSRYHAGREAVFEGIREAKEAVWQGFYEPGCYLYSEDGWNAYPAREAEQLSEQLTKHYQSGDVQELKQAVDRLFFIFQRGRVHPKFVQEFCYSMLIRLDGNFMETVKSVKGSALTDEFLLEDAAGLKSTFLRLMLSMRLEIEPENVRTEEEVIRQIRHYIDTNYEKDLSLTVLATHYFISKYQISRLFKKEFGINFSDYVLKVRMEAAGMMLRNSSAKLDEVAHRTGFEETSYFSRVFSKYYEITPGEYRKQQKR